MTTDTLERAHTLATTYPTMSAAQRLQLARFEATARPDWYRELAETGQTDRDGFTLTLTVKPDDAFDASWLGTWTDRWEPGAVANPDGYYRHSYRWFVPAITEDEHFRGLRDAKLGRRQARDLAREYVRQDMETARAYAPVYAVVAVTRAGVELGRAGVYELDDEDYARSWDVVDDLAAEALAEARATLAALCGS